MHGEYISKHGNEGKTAGSDRDSMRSRAEASAHDSRRFETRRFWFASRSAAGASAEFTLTNDSCRANVNGQECFGEIAAVLRAGSCVEENIAQRAGVGFANSDRMGAFVDSLGSRTAAGRWAIFLTQTYRTKSMVKRLNAPVEKPGPSPDFVRHFLRRMIRWLEDELRERVEFFIVDQYGERGGRLHQHGGLTSPGLLRAAEELSAMRCADPNTTRLPAALKPFAAMLVEQAGGNRILPWEQDAGYYIGRYIGRDVARCQWDFRVGSQPVRQIPPVGRQIVAVSSVPDETSSDAYRQALGKWHR